MISMLERRRRMLGDIDFRECVGIEIGALHSPVVPRSEGRIIYVDYAPTEELRQKFKHPGVDPAAVVDVDVIWGERPLGDAIAGPVDYAVASHVIEHVPDLIGWLLELHSVLKPGGILGLAVPDCRHTFDIYRAESTLAEMVEAYLLGYRRPSLRQVFDACAFSKNSEQEEFWRPWRRSGGLPREVLESLPNAYQWLKEEFAVRPSYVDAHCWVFTPASFLDAVEGMARIGCFPYAIADFFPTEPGSIEFQARLQSIGDSSDPAVANAIAAARQKLPIDDPVPMLRDRIAELERRNETLAATLNGMTKSKSWTLTAPLRSAMHLLRRD